MSSPSPTSAISSADEERSDPGKADQRFPKSRRLRRRSEFQKVYKQGVRAAGPLFSVFLLPRAEQAPGRVGLTVSRKVGKAVVRNRVKRWFREAIRQHWDWAPDGAWIVFHARNEARDSSYQQIEAELERLLAKARRRGGYSDSL